MEFCIRPGRPADFSAVVAIQDASAQTSAWTPEALGCVLDGRSDYGLLVAERNGAAIAFLLWRALPEDETEILTLAVEPAFRRRGAALALLREVLENRSGACFLEVRESNAAARRLYRKMGFERVGVRQAYYHRPVENALVMRRTEILPKDAI